MDGDSSGTNKSLQMLGFDRDIGNKVLSVIRATMRIIVCYYYRKETRLKLYIRRWLDQRVYMGERHGRLVTVVQPIFRSAEIKFLRSIKRCIKLD